MRVRPIAPAALPGLLAERIAGRAAGRYVRVALDGPPAAEPGALAERLVDPLRVLGRAVVRVPSAGFLRPASLRFEHGREDPDAYYDDWLDAPALAREVLDPLDEGGSGRYLPSLWDPLRDRATREPYRVAPPGAVVLVDGPLLLGRWLAFDLTIALVLGEAALRRRTPAELLWTLPAFARYADDVGPEQVADVVVRVDDPRHPALVERVD